MLSYVFNPFTSNFDSTDKLSVFSASNPIIVYPDDTIVIQHPPVTNMMLLPLVYEHLAEIGKTAIGYSMDWQGEYTQEISGDIAFVSGSVRLRDAAPPVTSLYEDARDLATTHNLKTGSDVANDFVYVDDYGTPTLSYNTATGLKTTGTSDSINWTLPSTLDIPWNYNMFVVGYNGTAECYVDNVFTGSAILEDSFLEITRNSVDAWPTTENIKVTAILSDRILLVTATTAYVYKLYVSYDEAKTFSLINSSFYTITEMIALPNDVVIAVNAQYNGYKGIYRSTDKGNTFTPIPIATATTAVIRPCYVNNRLIAYGYTNTLGEGTNAQLFVSDDYGLTFTEKTLPEASYSSYRNEVFYVLGKYIITYYSSGYGNTIYYSTDLTSWTKVTTTNMTSVGFVVEHNSAAYIIGTVTQTTSDFVTFTTVSLTPFAPSGNTRSTTIKNTKAFIDNSGRAASFLNGIVSMHYIGPALYYNISTANNGKLLYITQPNTATFGYKAVVKKKINKNKVIHKNITDIPVLHTKPLGISVAWKDIVSDNGNTLIATSVAGYCSVSTDSGDTFTQKVMPVQGQSIIFCSAINAFLSVGSQTTGGVIKTTDAGTTWSAHGTYSTNTLSSKLVYFNNILYWICSGYIAHSLNNGVDFSTLISSSPGLYINKLDDNFVINTYSSKQFNIISKAGQAYLSSSVGVTVNIYAVIPFIDDMLIIQGYDGIYTYKSSNIIEFLCSYPANFFATNPPGIFHNGILFLVNAYGLAFTTDFKTWQSITFPVTESPVKLYVYKTKLFILVSNRDYCYYIDVPDRTIVKTLVAGNVINIKSNNSKNIHSIGISVNPADSVVSLSGNSGEYLVKLPDYVNPRYFITDAWDVAAHRVISFTSFTMSSTVPANTSVYSLVSLDDGATWKTISGGVFVDVTVTTLREAVNTHGVLLSNILTLLSGITPGTQKIKFLIDMRTTDATQSPVISAININYVQEGIYQQAQTGKGTDWEVYNMTESQTVFAYKGIQQTTALIHILPLG